VASRVLDALKKGNQRLHNVGSLNDWNKNVLNQGAKVAESDIDNFELVELRFNANGERECVKLADVRNKGYLIATPEDYMEGCETISSFFNGVGDMARIVRMKPGMRFECSNVKLENEDTERFPLKNGMRCYYDIRIRQFVISNETLAGIGSYPIAGNQQVLVDSKCSMIDGKTVYRFEVTK
jgi:hypothetical protein